MQALVWRFFRRSRRRPIAFAPLDLFRLDSFEKLGRENCTVSALRAQASHVDTSLIRGQGGKPPTEDAVKRPVTVADAQKQLATALDG